MKATFKFVTTICLLIGLLGCAKSNVYYPGSGASHPVASGTPSAVQTYWDKIKQLEQELMGLSATIDKAEGRILAETAVRESAVLAEEYQLVRPAVSHNLLVVFGVKDRGLCYHWTEDLMKRLQTLDLKSVQLHWGVAYRGSELREHNCVVITARGQPFFQGIVLDPWRNSGNLYWARVTKDSYPWKVLPPSDW
ncbi:MAG: hypothetical protein OET18_05810 [Desulfobacterales bacterium]|nr:hypothetical protein [Desulfobacterales bacterium]